MGACAKPGGGSRVLPFRTALDVSICESGTFSATIEDDVTSPRGSAVEVIRLRFMLAERWRANLAWAQKPQPDSSHTTVSEDTAGFSEHTQG